MKRGSAGGRRTAIIARKKAILGYYKNPKYCKQCRKIIRIKRTNKVTIVKRRKFCNRKCSGKFRKLSKKNKILKLFYNGKKYSEISKILTCSKGTISYYCSKLIPKDKRYTNEKIKKYQKYYDTYGNTLRTAEYFSVSVSSLKKYLKLKKKIFTRGEMKKRRIKQVGNWRRRIKIRAIESKGGKCQNCSYNKCVYSLDFHHINPNKKEFAIGSSKVNNWGRIKKELDKCILVCRNCHGQIHEEIDLKGNSKILNKILKKKSM